MREDLISSFLGWGYFAAWSVSFYPQTILNWKRKSYAGVSADFIVLGLIGFVCYAVYNSLLYWSPTIQQEYKRRNDGKEALVQLNDVIFAIHAAVLSFVGFMQTRLYSKTEEQRAHKDVIMLPFAILTAGSLSITILLVIYNALNWLDFVSLSLTIDTDYTDMHIYVAYLPQAYLNYRRKSTIGWSIYNILLDLTGGTLSMIQLIYDAITSNNIEGIWGNGTKLALSILTLCFDFLFILQHFSLYRTREPADSSDRNEEEISGLLIESID